MSYAEILRLIREDEPAKPSTRLKHSETLPSVAAARQMEPAKLTKYVRGELDWIVLKALEKDRNRRYETANGLAKDVQRYLHDEPVLACPPSAWYRFRKAVRRHKTALLAAAGVVVALAGIAASIGWAVRDRGAREEALDHTVTRTLTEGIEPLLADGKWSEALAAVNRADELLAAAGRTERPQRLVQLREELVLVQRLEEIPKAKGQAKTLVAIVGDREHRLQETVFSEADYFSGRQSDETFAEVFRDFGIDVDALTLEEAAAEIQRRSVRPALVKALDEWAPLRRSARGQNNADWKKLVAIARLADPDPWRNRCREALLRRDRRALEELVEAVPLHQVPPATLWLLGLTLKEVGALDKAMSLLTRAQHRYPDDFWINDTLGSFSWLEFKPPRTEDALRYYSIALSLRPSRPQLHYMVAVILGARRAFEEAVVEYSIALELDPKYTPARDNLRSALLAGGKSDEAIAECRKAIERNPKDFSAHLNLGIALSHQGKLDEAIACYQKAITLEPIGPGARFLVSNAHFLLANACARWGRWDQALAAMDKAAELTPNDHWRLFLAAPLDLQVGDLAGYRRICREMLQRFGDTKEPAVADRIAKTCLLAPEAVADLDGVLKLADRAVTGTEKNPFYRYFLFCKGLAEYRAGRHAEAVQWLERVAPKASGGIFDGSAFAVLALAQHHRSRGEEALLALDRVEVIVAAKLPDPADGRPFADIWHDWLRCQVLLREAEELLKPEEDRLHFYRGLRRGCQDKWPEAEAEYRQAIRLRPNWYEAHYQLAVAIEEQGRQKDARAAYREALRLKPKQPEGPPRSTLVTPWSDTEQWVVKDQEVHQHDESHLHKVLFGDPDWTDYNFEAEVEIIAGGSEVGLFFRATSPDDYLCAVVGAFGNTRHGVLGKGKTWFGSMGMVQGQSKKGCWYRLRVEARGDRFKMFLDGKLLTTFESDQYPRGCVGLRTKEAHARFRNLKVTDATGKVLLEGVQDVLPKPKDERTKRPSPP